VFSFEFDRQQVLAIPPGPITAPYITRPCTNPTAKLLAVGEDRGDARVWLRSAIDVWLGGEEGTVAQAVR
jgi:hypothetical protein